MLILILFENCGVCCPVEYEGVECGFRAKNFNSTKRVLLKVLKATDFISDIGLTLSSRLVDPLCND